MAVGSGTPYNEYTGNGVSTVFAYGFTLLDEDDLTVTINGSVTSAYTVSLVGNPSGGSITFTSAPANGAIVLLRREIALERLTDYQTNGDLQADTVNADFDRLWLAVQQGSDTDTRTIRAPGVEVLNVLPAAADRALQTLTFDAQGQPTVSVPTSGSIGDFAANLATDDDETKGAGMVGVGFGESYSLGTVGWALIKGTYNAAQRGALGDGSTDDAPIINAGLASGRWVELPTPSVYYKVNSALAIPQRGGIIGESAHATIIRRAGGSGSVITIDGSSGDGGPYLLRNLRLGGAGCKGITELAGGYTNYIARLRLEDVFTEADLAYGIEANLIYFMADGWRDGYYQQTSIHASHQALAASFAGSLNTNVNNLKNCYFGFSPAAYAVTLSGGVNWRFEQCDWSVNKRNLYAVNVSSLQLLQTYTEGGNPVTGSLFVVDPTTRATAIFDGGTYDGGSMASGCAMFGFATTAKAQVKHADIIVSSGGFAYLNTTTLANFPTAGHEFNDNSYAGNTSDPLYPFSGVRQGGYQAWVPVPNGLPVAGTPGTAAYGGFWSINNRMVTVGIVIEPNGTSTTAATAATTYFTLPTGIPAPAYTTAGSVFNEVLGSIGACMAYDNGRVYMPAWTAQQNNITITVTYPI